VAEEAAVAVAGLVVLALGEAMEAGGLAVKQARETPEGGQAVMLVGALRTSGQS